MLQFIEQRTRAAHASHFGYLYSLKAHPGEPDFLGRCLINDLGDPPARDRFDVDLRTPNDRDADPLWRAGGAEGACRPVFLGHRLPISVPTTPVMGSHNGHAVIAMWQNVLGLAPRAARESMGPWRSSRSGSPSRHRHQLQSHRACRAGRRRRGAHSRAQQSGGLLSLRRQCRGQALHGASPKLALGHGYHDHASRAHINHSEYSILAKDFAPAERLLSEGFVFNSRFDLDGAVHVLSERNAQLSHG